MLPKEKFNRSKGCGSGMTCWRRLRDWEKAGVWEKLHKLLLDTLNEAGEGRRTEIGWSRASLDSQMVRAMGVKRGARHRPEPDR